MQEKKRKPLRARPAITIEAGEPSSDAFHAAERFRAAVEAANNRRPKDHRTELLGEELEALAQRVLGGPSTAHAWLTTYIPALDARPVDLLSTPAGVRRVEEALHQIEHGMFA